MRRGRVVVGGSGERGAVEEMGEEAAAEGRRAAREKGGRAAPGGKTGKEEREARAVRRGTAAPLQENKS